MLFIFFIHSLNFVIFSLSTTTYGSCDNVSFVRKLPTWVSELNDKHTYSTCVHKWPICGLFEPRKVDAKYCWKGQILTGMILNKHFNCSEKCILMWMWTVEGRIIQTCNNILKNRFKLCMHFLCFFVLFDSGQNTTV